MFEAGGAVAILYMNHPYLACQILTFLGADNGEKNVLLCLEAGTGRGESPDRAAFLY